MKKVLLMASLGIILAGCASSENMQASTVDDDYTPTGSHLKRKAGQNNQVSTIAKEDLEQMRGASSITPVSK